MIVMSTGSADFVQWMISGEIDLSIRAKRPPASPVNVPAITNAVHWYSMTLIPRYEARCPFSRIALSVAPKGEERTRRRNATARPETTTKKYNVDLGEDMSR